MPKKKASIYHSMYTIVLMIVLAFFAHNPFQSVHYDVLNIRQTIHLFGYSYYIRDIFPFFDAPATGYYGEPLRMDIQSYVYRLSYKFLLLAFSVGMYQLSITLNLFLQDLPGRKFVRLPYILIVLIGLFLYELLDFLFYAGQTDWIYQAIAVGAALTAIALFVRK